MMRTLLLLSLVLISSVVTTYAEPQQPKQYATTNTTNPLRENIKVKLCRSANYIGAGGGLLVEYKLTEKIGLQSGLIISWQAYPLRYKNLTSVYPYLYAGIPLTLRYYVGETKQFCWFGGFHISYCPLVLGLMRQYSADIGNRYQISINVGFDYETKLGFIGGITLCEQDLLYMPGKPARMNYPRIVGFTVGYNFVRLFHILWKTGN